MRINEWGDYETTTGETITKGKMVCITYVLVPQTSKYQYDWCTWVKNQKQTRSGQSYIPTLSRRGQTCAKGNRLPAKGSTPDGITTSSECKINSPTWSRQRHNNGRPSRIWWPPTRYWHIKWNYVTTTSLPGRQRMMTYKGPWRTS